MAAAGLAEALLAQGRLADAVAAVEQIPEEVAVDRNHATGIHLLRARGQVRAATGDHEGALSSLRLCAQRLAELDMDSPTWCGWRAVAVESLWALGRVEEARELAATELAVAEQKAGASMLGQALRVAGEVAATDGIALLERSVDVLTGSQARLQEARSRVALGAALRRTGQRVQGREQLRIGRELAHRLGARLLTERASTELALAGGDDYELLFTARPTARKRLRAVERQLGELPITRIGVVTRGSTVVLGTSSGDRDLPAGFEHFRQNGVLRHPGTD